MHHILILRELSKRETEKVKSLSKQKDVLVFVDPDFTVSSKFAKHIEKLSEEEKKSINYQTLSEILDFGDTVIDGQPVSKHLNFYGSGLWYYHKFRIYFKIRNQNYTIAEIERNLSGASSAKLYVSDKLINSSHFILDDVEIEKPKKSEKQKVSISAVLMYGFTVLFRSAKSILTPISKITNQKILCIDTIGQYRDILDLDGSGAIFENAYLGYLFKKNGDQIGFLDQLLIPKFKGIDRFHFDKKALKNHNQRARIFSERIMGKALFSIKIIKQLLEVKKELRQTYQLLKVGLQSKPKQLGILEEFTKLNSTSLFYLFKFFAYSKFFGKNKFKAVLTTDENSPNFKVILDAAKKHGIFTVGYQHGSIHELHPAYIYTKIDMTQAPVPDLTIAWGKKWKDLLINHGNYPEERIGVAGQIRTDIIKKLEQNQQLDKHSVFKDVKEKQIVLFATQPQRDPELRCKAAEDVVLACKNIKNAHLVFKLHPREQDPEFYENIAWKHGLVNYTISRDEELYVLLHISDVVITCFSTVGSEALYFKKPLIILDHLKQDILNYHKDGVAFQASNAEELSHLIREVLSGNLSIDASILNQYLHESTFAIDGKVVDRVWDYVNRGL